MSETALEWRKLLSERRRKPKRVKARSAGSTSTPAERRTETERDFDRILFSTPVRRLADKTQVFPLEQNDSVRTRLTHSHEVANLARSMGTAVAYQYPKLFGGIEDDAVRRNVPSMLAAIGLAHDLGNPPFGHQGEAAIADWFRTHQSVLSDSELSEQMREDFCSFEGNAQTLRVLTRLQIISDEYGLNLTCGTLAALMKYTVASHEVSENSSSTKKYGYFFSEEGVFHEVREETGLPNGVRHPFAFLMEVCDDIAYTVLDAEDCVKKGLVSISDVFDCLDGIQKSASGACAKLAQRVADAARADHEEHRTFNLSPRELNDISMQKLRVYAIGEMVNSALDAFVATVPNMMKGVYTGELIKDSAGADLRNGLKSFARQHGYKNREVLEVELKGRRVIQELMDIFWEAIEANTKGTIEQDPWNLYVYSRISENYRRVHAEATSLPQRYRDCQLLTDMMSGMTDRYAVALHAEFQRLKHA